MNESQNSNPNVSRKISISYFFNGTFTATLVILFFLIGGAILPMASYGFDITLLIFAIIDVLLCLIGFYFLFRNKLLYALATKKGKATFVFIDIGKTLSSDSSNWLYHITIKELNGNSSSYNISLLSKGWIKRYAGIMIPGYLYKNKVFADWKCSKEYLQANENKGN
jgi:hypothetical protein